MRYQPNLESSSLGGRDRILEVGWIDVRYIVRTCG
jgi:hypothetical protein